MGELGPNEGFLSEGSPQQIGNRDELQSQLIAAQPLGGKVVGKLVELLLFDAIFHVASREINLLVEALAAAVITASASQIGLSTSCREQRIVAQLIVIIEVFVAQGEAQNTLLEESLQWVLNEFLVARIVEISRESSPVASLPERCQKSGASANYNPAGRVAPAQTSVPRPVSPVSAFVILPGLFMSNTMTRLLFSMQRLKAAASMTFN